MANLRYFGGIAETLEENPMYNTIEQKWAVHFLTKISEAKTIESVTELVLSLNPDLVQAINSPIINDILKLGTGLRRNIHKSWIAEMCKAGKLSTVKFLYWKCPYYSIDEMTTCFRYACKFNRLRTAKWLLSVCRGIDYAKWPGWTMQISIESHTSETQEWLKTLST